MFVVNEKPVKELGLAEIPIKSLRPKIDDLRDEEIKKLFKQWFNWPNPEYAPDFIIIHPSLEPFIKPFIVDNEQIDLIVDKNDEYKLCIRLAIMG